MAEFEPLRALRYEPAVAGPLERLVAPPYDVIDEDQRRRLAERAPHNVVRLDLPVGEDRYAAAAALLDAWQRDGALVREREPALWALSQDYAAPDGTPRRRHGVLGRIRVEDYGAGRIRPHERTHPGPKRDRLALTRATHANLSPIFALYSDPALTAWRALEPVTAATAPWAQLRDDDGTVHRAWPIRDPALIAAVQAAVAPAELLIADGHHRYETARAYATEVGGEGSHRFVLACLVALEDPGLTIFPTHRLLRGLDDRRRAAIHAALQAAFTTRDVDARELVPAPAADGRPLALGLLDGRDGRPQRLELRDPTLLERALPRYSPAYRELDTVVLETIVLRGALGMTDEDIAQLRGLGYARSAREARALVARGEFDAAFFLAPTPVQRVQAVAAAGESMPPKSTFFYPKLLTGVLFNPLWGE